MDNFLKEQLEKAKARYQNLCQEVEGKVSESHKYIGMREEAALHLQECALALNEYLEEIKNKSIE